MATKKKPPTKLERYENLEQRIQSLCNDLMNEGFGALLPPPTKPVVTIADPIFDPKTEGYVAHVEEPLGAYIQRASVKDNYSQRPPFDHLTDPIYKRLIKDFIEGAVMPESKVAALSRTSSSRKANSLTEEDIQYSVIDGLQRLYCYYIAILLVRYREELVTDRCIPIDAWEDFKEVVIARGESKIATEELLKRTIRYEIFYQIDLAGLLHYMVTFNTGQRRMSISVQLEIMRKTIHSRTGECKIPIWEDIQSVPGLSKPKEKFLASELVMAAQAFFQ
jgi:hypothetical protein